MDKKMEATNYIIWAIERLYRSYLGIMERKSKLPSRVLVGLLIFISISSIGTSQ